MHMDICNLPRSYEGKERFGVLCSNLAMGQEQVTTAWQSDVSIEGVFEVINKAGFQ